MPHLIGKTVDIVADGAVQTQQTVDGSGNVTLPRASYRTLIGLHFRSEIGLLTPEVGTGTGTAQGNSMRTSEISLRFLNTIRAQVYDGEGNEQDVPFRRFRARGARQGAAALHRQRAHRDAGLGARPLGSHHRARPAAADAPAGRGAQVPGQRLEETPMSWVRVAVTGMTAFNNVQQGRYAKAQAAGAGDVRLSGAGRAGQRAEDRGDHPARRAQTGRTGQRGVRGRRREGSARAARPKSSATSRRATSTTPSRRCSRAAGVLPALRLDGQLTRINGDMQGPRAT